MSTKTCQNCGYLPSLCACKTETVRGTFEEVRKKLIQRVNSSGPQAPLTEDEMVEILEFLLIRAREKEGVETP